MGDGFSFSPSPRDFPIILDAEGLRATRTQCPRSGSIGMTISRPRPSSPAQKIFGLIFDAMYWLDSQQQPGRFGVLPAKRDARRRPGRQHSLAAAAGAHKVASRDGHSERVDIQALDGLPRIP